MKHVQPVLRAVTPLAAASAALFSPSPLLAQSSSEAPPARSAGVVVITGSQPTSLPTHIPTTIEGVTGKQVQDTVNATDSEDALKYLPSLLVRKRYIGDYNHAVLSTRASGTGNSARSLVFADGILLSNLLGNGATFAPRWGLVTPEEIERVDVLYGPFSAAYSGNSVGAVVDYVTRMPRKFEAHAKIGAFTQPFDLYNTNARYSGWQASASVGDRQDALAWWINVNRLDSESQPLVFPTRTVAAGTAGPGGTPVTGAVLDKNRANQDWYILGASTQYRTVQDHLKAKLAYDFTQTLRASYTLGVWQNKARANSETYLRDGAGTPVYSGDININGRAYVGTAPPPARALTASDFPLGRDRLEHVMHAVSLKSVTKGVFDWEVAASLYDYENDRARVSTTAQPGAAAGGPGRITDQDGTGWNTLALKGVWRPAGSHVVDMGLQQETYKLRSVVSSTADWISGDPAAVTSRFEGNTRLLSAYAQDSWRLAERWKAVVGGRFEHWTAWGGRTFSSAPAPGATHAHPERSEDYFSPKAAVAFEASDEWVIKTSLGRAVRMPTVSELYQGGFNNAGVFTNNDPNLKAEKSWTGELSAEWDTGSRRLRTTLFYERTRDALYSQFSSSFNTNTIQNVGLVRTRGLELAWQSENLFKGFDLASSLTYADSKILENSGFVAIPGDTIGKWQPRIPRWRATLLATWRPNDRWTATFGARYSGRQYSTLDNSDPNGFAYQGTSPFFTTDVRLRYRFDKHWTAAFGVDNLNNYKYWNFHPYPQRTYSAELQVDL